MSVNKQGYLVNVDPSGGSPRTYACTSKDGLEELIVHLTGRSVTSYQRNRSGLPIVPKIFIASGLHIYDRE